MYNSNICNKLINAKIIFINNNVQYQATLLAIDNENRYYCLTSSNSRQFTITEISESDAREILSESY